jgi:2,4-dienoyl-CoA reductase-like NADH-dependent reductase (Old Yellow Enzyme family)
LTGAATISVGSVGLSGEFVAAFAGQSSTSVGIDNLIQRMERNEFDLIAVGRALISDPDWVIKIREGDDAGLAGFDSKHLNELI